MNYIKTKNNPEHGSILYIESLLALILMISTFLRYHHNMANMYLEQKIGTSISPYAWYMLVIILIAFLIFIGNSTAWVKERRFIYYGFLYSVAGFLSLLASRAYTPIEWPMIMIDISYWLWIIVLSYFGSLKINTLKYFTFASVVAVSFYLVTFFRIRQGFAVESTRGYNAIFYISYFLPPILLLKSKVVKSFYLVLIFAAIIVSVKRAPLVGYLTAVASFYFCTLKFKGIGISRKLLAFLGLALLFIILAILYKELSAMGFAIGTRMENVVKDQGSGRIGIFLATFNHLSSQSFFEWIIGNGYGAANRVGIGRAHNDIVDILFAYGVIGLIFYLLFIYEICKIFLDMMRFNYRHAGAFAASLAMYFWIGNTEMSITIPYSFILNALFWGWVIADFHNAKRYADPERLGVLS
ncbi:Lipid A core - O-antigen ligase [Sedimentisphaera cyanobacteriorum]|uniref:Lipid A core-O-antigen ligase n=1 Tax=Sedimentisphaera cyanobacteriorum TaxID=1940790 RepID=A0A1Q2HPJ4_9BACT|nr:hypothetical protein [Sedimentisphaera cyanobacteriorum]AQQ09165.1 Lipid A core - O-antigen ligase [Sedimentisphaera cyanobacteriorum]